MGLFMFSFLLVGSQAHAEDTPSITVTSPNNGGESIEVGGKIEIRWMSPNISSALNEIYISDGTHKGHTEKVRMENNEGSVIYTLDSNLIPGSNYKAYVSTAYGSAVSVSDSSDNSFTIKSAVSVLGTPSITVLSPNGGEVYQAGQQITVKWKSQNLPQDAKIRVILESPRDLVSSFNPPTYYVSNSGYTTFTLPKESDFIKGYAIPWGKNFRFEVAAPNSNVTASLALDFSDNTFSIKELTTDDTTPSINVSGCTANSNFSITTGQACPKILTENKGCLSGYKFSPITGQACKEDTTVVSNESSSDVSTSDTVTTTPIKRTLKKGIKGDDVKILQLFLNLAADGSFGPQTQQKVMEWQVANGLTPDGAFGIKSATKAGLVE